MFWKLIYIVFAILGLFVVDKFSTFFAVVICILLIYFYILTFYVDKNRFIVILIKKIRGGFFYVFLLGKYIILVFRNVFCYSKYLKRSRTSSWEHCGKTVCLEKEIDVIVFNISQYYLHSWYDKIGNKEEFILQLNSVIKETLINLCSKVTKVNKRKTLYAILQIYLHFLIHFIDTKKISEIKLADFEMKHWALQDSMTEWCYLQSLVSSLVDICGPNAEQTSLRNKYRPILHNFIVEILTEHILHPLSALISDPFQLNSWLLRILESFVLNDGNFAKILDCECSSANTVPSNECNSGPKILLDVEDSFQNCIETENKTYDSQYQGTTTSMSDVDDDNEYQTNEIIEFSKLKENCDCLSPFMSSDIKSSSNINLLDSDSLSVRASMDGVFSPVSCDTCTIKRSKSADYIRQMPQLRALNMRDYNIVKENNKMRVALKSDLNSSGFIEQAEEAIEVPNLFSDVRISDTLQHNEVGFLPYTLYCIQYIGVFHDTTKQSEKPHFIKQEVSIKRRFREFLALQSRLEDNPSLKNYLKGIKGPSKWLALPFSNMDKKNIAERKSFLENYLKELCSQGPIAQSSELQEFLAYGGDATVAFVKKPGDISVPRIDKIFVRGVKGAIDMFRTALPNSAVEGGCSSESSPAVKPYSEDSCLDHKFQEHLLEFSSREPEIREYLKHYFKNVASIPESEHLLSSNDCHQNTSLLRHLYKLKVENYCKCSTTWDKNDRNFILEENPFGNTVIDMIIESLKISDFSSFHLLSVLKLLLSPAIDRYLTSMADEFSEHHLAVLLHLLHKVLWPENSNICKNTKSESKCPCSYNKLKQCIKVFISTSSVTMHISCIEKLCLEQIYLFLSSIQHQQLNRCLLFHIFDIVIDTVCSKDI